MRAHTWGVVATELLETDPLRVGGVQVVGRLGEGGMGVVYLGRRPGGTAVAIKVVRTDLAGDADFRRRFALEVSALRGLGGVHTAAVLDADVDADQPWMVMEYVQGPTLGDRVSRLGALPIDEFDEFADNLLRATVAIWQAGIVHRDLKPSNVVLSPSGVKLLDFGVARFRGESLDPARVGSTTWMAPEQLSGSGDDSRCDVHACAMLLYFAATGRHVYGYGDAEAVGWRIRNTTPHLVDLPSQLTHLRPALLAALEKDPARRPNVVQLLNAVSAGPDGTAVWVGQTPATPVAATAVGPSVGPAAGTPVAGGVAAGAPAAVPVSAAASIVGSASAAEAASRPPVAASVTPTGSAAPAPAQPPAQPSLQPSRQPPAQPTGVGRLVSRVRTWALVFAALWLVGWTVGMWPLGGPWAPTQAAAQDCFVSAQPADFSSGSAFATAGSGTVSRSILGKFPGPFGEFRVPTTAVGCQLGREVTVTCPESTLPDGAVLSCQAVDATGGTKEVVVSRTADTWNWWV